MTVVRPALIARLYQAIEQNRMSDAVLLLSQVFTHIGQSRFARDGMFLAQLCRLGDEFTEEGDATSAEEHYKLALALYEAFFIDHHDEALCAIRRLCDVLDKQQREAELGRFLEWAYIIIQRLNAHVLGEVQPAALEAVNWQKLFVRDDERMVVGGGPVPRGRDRSSIQVLLVEDNPTDAELLHELLAEGEHEFKIEWAQRLADGIRKAGEGNIDVVLLDLTLPDSTSLETFYRLSSSLPTVPVIVLTGTDDRSMAIRAIKRGAHDFLVKGKDDDRVIVRSILEAVERRKHRELERISVLSASRSVEHSIMHAVSPFAFIDRRGIVQNVNQPWLDALRQERHALIGKLITDVLPELSPGLLENLLDGASVNVRATIDGRPYTVDAWSVDSPDNGAIGALVQAHKI